MSSVKKNIQGRHLVDLKVRESSEKVFETIGTVCADILQ